MKYSVLLFCIVFLAAPTCSEAQDANEGEPEVTLSEATKIALDRSKAELVDLPDGRRQLVLNGGHKHVMLAKMGKDGKIEMFCAGSEDQAKHFFSGAEKVQKTP